MAEDNDISLPRTTLQKMIKDLLPPDMRVANDTVELVIACCTEFIQLMSSEANEVAMREGRTIIHPDHVLRALTDLGFPSFAGEVTAAWATFKEDTKTAHSRKADLRKTGAEHAGLSEEEQILLQQQMFAQARAQSLTTSESAAAMQAAYEQVQAAQAHGGGAAQHHPPYGGSSGGGGGGPGQHPAGGLQAVQESGMDEDEEGSE